VLRPNAVSRLTRVAGGVLVVGVVLLGAVLTAPEVARADFVVCTGDVTKQNTCSTEVTEESRPGDPSMNPETGFTPSPPVCLDLQNRNDNNEYVEIPCHGDLGWWSNSSQCYQRLSDAQRPAPQGEDPAVGAWYDCNKTLTLCDLVTACNGPFTFSEWLRNPPPGVDALTPGQAARSLIESFQLEGITVGFAPDPTVAGSKSYVGVPIWMWAENPTPLSYGPYVQSTTLGGVTITATAQVTSIVWNMGDGTSVACANAGTPFVVAYGAVDSPTCGHRYARTSGTQPGGTFPITATSQWQVSWEGGGESGTIPLTTTATSAVRINEIQSVNVGAER